MQAILDFFRKQITHKSYIVPNKISIILLALSLITLLTSSCNDNIQDSENLSCKITKPLDNDTIKKGNILEIVAEADYSSGDITELVFFADEISIATSKNFPYSYNWDTKSLSSGWHKIKALARAGDGAERSDEINILIIGDASQAPLGNDTLISDGSTTLSLYANAPKFEYENGQWTIKSGEGGSFENETNPITKFTGKLAQSYILRWSIYNKYDSTFDEQTITFRKLELGSLTDFDGNTYKTVKIGNQWWMTENLKSTHESDGTEIAMPSDNTEWSALNDTAKAYCYYNNNENNEKNTFGALYTFEAAKAACPEGWHLPTDDEWKELKNYIASDGYSNTIALALKSTTSWGDRNGIDAYGFTALPGGVRTWDTGFGGLGNSGMWWSATEFSNMADGWGLDYNFWTFASARTSGMSVRCVKDN